MVRSPRRARFPEGNSVRDGIHSASQFGSTGWARSDHHQRWTFQLGRLAQSSRMVRSLSLPSGSPMRRARISVWISGARAASADRRDTRASETPRRRATSAWLAIRCASMAASMRCAAASARATAAGASAREGERGLLSGGRSVSVARSSAWESVTLYKGTGHLDDRDGRHPAISALPAVRHRHLGCTRLSGDFAVFPEPGRPVSSHRVG